jgi:protein dithiol:quinone oxidoreductase
LISARRQRRWLNSLGVAAVIGLMSYALYAQHVLGLEACPLCIFQRIALLSVGLVFAVAALHAPPGAGARVYAVLGVLASLTGVGISGWHVWLQNLPPAEVPACGPGLGYMLDAFPLADINWAFLGLSMPAWVLVWFVALGALVAVANWGRLAR